MKNVEIELTPNLRNVKVFIDGEELKSVHSVSVVGNAVDILTAVERR